QTAGEVLLVTRKHMDLASRLKDALRTPTRVSSLQAEVSALSARLEFLRSELLYELRYGRPEGRPAEEAIAPRILSTEKVAAQRIEGLRLNLGCGHVPLEGYINVDMRDVPGVDIVAPVDNLPLEPGSVAEIFSSHLIEH